MLQRGLRGLRRQAGFTLPEMMIVMVVIALMLGIAVPSFSGLLARNSLSSKMNEMVGAMQAARSEAVTRNTRVSICKRKSDGTETCDSGSAWQNGWVAFVDPNGNAAIDAGETVLGTGAAVANFTFALEDAGGTAANAMTFRPDGSADDEYTMTICRGNKQYEGRIVIGVTGRPATEGSPTYPIVNC